MVPFSDIGVAVEPIGKRILGFRPERSIARPLHRYATIWTSRFASPGGGYQKNKTRF